MSLPVVCNAITLPIEWFSEVSDWHYHGFIDAMDAKKLTKLDHLEEVKVATTFPEVNLWKDGYCNMTKTHCEQYQTPRATFWF